jgi:hypothetical protein
VGIGGNPLRTMGGVSSAESLSEAPDLNEQQVPFPHSSIRVHCFLGRRQQLPMVITPATNFIERGVGATPQR